MRKHLIPLLAISAFLTSADAAGAFFCADTLTNTLNDVVVTSTRTDRQLAAPVSSYTLDAELMTAAGITDIGDALRRLPGLNLRDYGGAGGMKTVSVRGLGSQHTAVVYDGMALSDCQNGQIDLSRYSLDNLAALTLNPAEVGEIFIPARNTASASVLFIDTENVNNSEKVQGNVKLRAGQFEELNPFGRISWNVTDGVRLSANADFLHAGNNYPFTLTNDKTVTRENRHNSAVNSAHGELSALVKTGDQGKLTLKLYGYDSNRDLPGPVKYYVNESNEHIHERNWFAQGNWRGRLADKLWLRAGAKFNWLATRYKDIDGKYPGGILDHRYSQRETYTTASLLYIPSPEVSIDYSADWALAQLGSNVPRSANHPERNSVWQNLAVKWNHNRLSLLARGLLSIFKDHDGSDINRKTVTRFSPSAAASFRVTDDNPLFLKCGVKNMFRMPTFNELYYDNTSNDPLRPENTWQFSLGSAWQFNGNGLLSELTVTAEGYMNLIDDKIVAIPYNLFMWSMKNMGRARTLGADVTANGTVQLDDRHSILLVASWSYQRAAVRTSRTSSDWNRQIAYIPLNSGSCSLTWLNPWVAIAASANGCGTRYTANSNLPQTRMEGYAEFGCSLFRDINIKQNLLELRLDVSNLLNTQYEVIARYPMPGRQIRASVGLKF